MTERGTKLRIKAEDKKHDKCDKKKERREEGGNRSQKCFQENLRFQKTR